MVLEQMPSGAGKRLSEGGRMPSGAGMWLGDAGRRSSDAGMWLGDAGRRSSEAGIKKPESMQYEAIEISNIICTFVDGIT